MIPTWTYALIAVAFVSVGALGGYTLHGWQFDAKLKDVQLQCQKRERAVLEAQVTAQDDAMKVTTERIAAQKVNDDEQARFDRVAADAHAAADREHVRVLDAARSVAAACESSRGADHPAAVVTGASAPAAGVVPADALADVFGRADETAGELAAALDAAWARGTRCEHDYDALKVTP